MDPLSQGLLGACFSSSFAKKNNFKMAALCGTVGGITPDLDVFIKSDTDPLLFLEYHRHFTHSLVFVPLGGLFVSLFLIIFLKNYSFKQIYLFSTLGFLTHGILDSCTSYGTNLFWPFSDTKIAWNIISIVDPIFTFILIFCMIFCFLYKSIKIIRFGTLLSFSYLIIGIFQYQNVKSYVNAFANKRGHKIERILLNPTIGNNILWRTVYEFNNNYYIDAVYMPLFGNTSYKKGSKVKVIDKEDVFPDINRNSIQRNDIRRFSYFSMDFIYLHPDYDNVIADLRYGTLPYDNKSLWGIKINENNSEQHVNFLNLRNFKSNQYLEFWSMLKGNMK